MVSESNAEQPNADLPLETKIRHKITWFRAPLATAATLVLLYYIRDLKWFWVGMPIAVFGEMIQLWSSSQIQKEKHLTISGPYSHVRNPMYIGRFFLILGFVVMTDIPWLIALYIVAFAIYAHRRVGREEPKLLSIFGDDYTHYCNETRRWLPGLKRYSRSENQRSSWARACGNGEQLNFYGMIVVLVLTYIRIVLLPNWG